MPPAMKAMKAMKAETEEVVVVTKRPAGKGDVPKAKAKAARGGALAGIQAANNLRAYLAEAEKGSSGSESGSESDTASDRTTFKRPGAAPMKRPACHHHPERLERKDRAKQRAFERAVKNGEVIPSMVAHGRNHSNDKANIRRTLKRRACAQHVLTALHV